MTCIAWDGKTLAADKRADLGYPATVCKIRKINGSLVGGSGDFANLISLYKWFENGCDVNGWPDCQKDEKRWTTMLVITPEKKIFKYEQEPVPFEIEDKFVVIGSGKLAALPVLAMGGSAKEAVEMAIRFDINCGNGVDTLELG